jgi:hypothetical protein
MYARVEMNKDSDHFYGGRIQVVAYGDGDMLSNPIEVVLQSTSISAMVAVSEEWLKNRKVNAAA